MVDSVASRLTCSREFAVKNIMIFCNIIASFLLYTRTKMTMARLLQK